MRSSRLLSILILLQLRQRLTAEQLAAEFEVSVRTIYRDLDSLAAAGIPVYGERGPGGGFQLGDGYRTRLTGLDPDEAEAMLLIGMPDEAEAMGLGRAAARARNKLLAALPASDSAGANRVAGRFHLDTVDWYRRARPTPWLATIARAVLDQRLLAMTYDSWEASRHWRVEPLGLVLKAGVWYLVAAAHDKVRCFNVAEVVSCEALDDTFLRPDDFDLGGWWAASLSDFEARLRPGSARVCASPVGLRRLCLLGAFARDAVAAAGPPDDQGWRALVLPLEAIDVAAPTLLGIGPEIEVIEPVELRDEIVRLARLVVQRGGSARSSSTGPLSERRLSRNAAAAGGERRPRSASR